MARRVGGLDEVSGRVTSKKMGRGRQVNFPITDNSTRGKRIARALWG